MNDSHVFNLSNPDLVTISREIMLEISQYVTTILRDNHEDADSIDWEAWESAIARANVLVDYSGVKK